MTQLGSARKGALTPEIVKAAAREGAQAGLLLKETAAGRAVVPADIDHTRLLPELEDVRQAVIASRISRTLGRKAVA